MAITTTNITGDIALPDGTIPSKSSVTFVMTGFDTDASADTTIAPRSVTSVLSDTGALDVDLWSNEDGERTTFYNVRLNIYNGNSPKVFDVGKIEVPTTGGPYDLNDLLPIAPPQGATVAEYIAQLQAAAASAEAAETNALASEVAAAASAAEAALYDGVWLDDVSALIADTSLTYTAGQPGTVVAGDYVRTRKEGFSYEVVASGATDEHIATSGGVKLYVEPDNAGLAPAAAFGVTADGVTDDTSASQAVMDLVFDGTFAGVQWPAGTIRLTSTIVCSASVITGRTFRGASRGGTTLEMATDNVPMLEFSIQFMHSWLFESCTFKYTNTQPVSNTSASVFKVFDHGGAPNGQIYNNDWKNIFATNFHRFMDVPDVLWWGNTYEDMWFDDFSGSINRIKGAAGEPRCAFRNLYISSATGTDALFDHNAVTARWDNIEVNVAGAAPMLRDTGGGVQMISHWGLEVASYDTTVTLFTVTNGRIYGDHIYTSTLDLGASADVTAFATGGTSSHVDLKSFEFSFNSIDSSAKFFVFNGAGPQKSHIGRVRGPLELTGSPRVQLNNIGATVSADFLAIDDWNDETRVQFPGDADLTMAYDNGTSVIFSTALTAARKVLLPVHTSGTGTQMFSGRKVRVSKDPAAGTGFDITVRNSSDSQTIATIPAASAQGHVELVWCRTGPKGVANWYIAEQVT